MQIDRTGTTVDEISLNATTLDFNGNADISGTLTVGNVVDLANVVYIAERGNAAADSAGKGQVWVKNNAGNELWFTDDVGVDFRIAGTKFNNQAGNYTLTIDDAERVIHKASGGAGETITIPANSSVSFPIGTAVAFSNSGGGTLTIAITTDTLVLASDGTTGSRTLADNGLAVAIKVASTTWKISGDGLT